MGLLLKIHPADGPGPAQAALCSGASFDPSRLGRPCGIFELTHVFRQNIASKERKMLYIAADPQEFNPQHTPNTLIPCFADRVWQPLSSPLRCAATPMFMVSGRLVLLNAGGIVEERVPGMGVPFPALRHCARSGRLALVLWHLSDRSQKSRSKFKECRRQHSA